jgi:hypothetical protein
MKILGHATLVFRDIHTGEVTKTQEGDNHIQDAAVVSRYPFSSSVFVSELNPGRQVRNVSSAANSLVGVAAKTLTQFKQPNMHLGEWVATIAPPSRDMVLRSCGLGDGSATVIGNASNLDTLVWFSNPCAFSTTESLTIHYRIQFVFTDNWKTQTAEGGSLSSWVVSQVARTRVGVSGHTLPLTASPYVRALATVNQKRLTLAGTPHAAEYVVNPNTALLDEEDNSRGSMESRYLTGTNVGQIVSWIEDKDTTVSARVAKAGDDPLQGVFAFNTRTPPPFYTTDYAQIGAGVMTVSASGWDVDDYPLYARLEVTNTGGIGVGEYSLSVRKHFGVEGNTYKNVPASLTYSTVHNGHFNPAVDGEEGVEFPLSRELQSIEYTTDDELMTTHPVALDKRTAAFLWIDSLSVTDILTGEGVSVHNTTLFGEDLLPRFLATGINQLSAAPSGDLFVACRNTGLYVLNRELTTLTVIDSTTTGLDGVTGCSAVCFGHSDRVWAYFEHPTNPGIYYSDDTGAGWAFSGMPEVGVPVMCVQADPSHAGGQLMLLVEGAPISIYRSWDVRWWDQTAGTLVDGPSSRIASDPHQELTQPAGHTYGKTEQVRCSPNDSVWFFAEDEVYGRQDNNVRRATFGTTTLDALGDSSLTHSRVFGFTTDMAGNDAVITAGGNQRSTPGAFLLSADGSYEYSPNTYTTANIDDNSNYIAYFGDGVFMFRVVTSGDPRLSYHTPGGSLNYFALLSCAPETSDLTMYPGITREVYDFYGWDSAQNAWVLGNPNSKPMHTAEQELIPGVTVNWDDLGSEVFNDTDSFSFGLCDGVWQDGATSFTLRREFYYRPAAQETDIETSVVPSSNRKPQKFTDWAAFGGNVDRVNFTSSLFSTSSSANSKPTYADSDGEYLSGARSFQPLISPSGETPYTQRVKMWEYSDDFNGVGAMSLRTVVNKEERLQAYVGMSDASVLGTPLGPDTMNFSVLLDSEDARSPDEGFCTVSILVDGVVVSTYADPVFYDDSTTTGKVSFGLLSDGTVIFGVTDYHGAHLEVGRTAPGAAAMVDYHLDLAVAANTEYMFSNTNMIGLEDQSNGRYLYLGNGQDTGLFTPEFVSIVSDRIEATIDGALATPVDPNDVDSVLPAGTFSLHTYGLVRFSDDDAGKSVSVKYLTLTEV